MEENIPTLKDYLESLKNFNFSNPQYKGMAYLQFYDDGSGSVKFIDDDMYPQDLVGFYELIENYR